MATANPTTPKKNQYLNDPENTFGEIIGASIGLGGARAADAVRYSTLVPQNVEAAEAMLRRLDELKSQVFLIQKTLSKLTWIGAQNEQVRKEMESEIYGIGLSQHYLTQLAESADFERDEIMFVLRDASKAIQ